MKVKRKPGYSDDHLHLMAALSLQTWAVNQVLAAEGPKAAEDMIRLWVRERAHSTLDDYDAARAKPPAKVPNDLEIDGELWTGNGVVVGVWSAAASGRDNLDLARYVAESTWVPLLAPVGERHAIVMLIIVMSMALDGKPKALAAFASDTQAQRLAFGLYQKTLEFMAVPHDPPAAPVGYEVAHKPRDSAFEKDVPAEPTPVEENQIWPHGLPTPVVEANDDDEPDDYPFAVWIDDVVAHEHEDLIAQLVRALDAAPGVTDVFHQDREQVLIAGQIDPSALGDWIEQWWIARTTMQ